MPFATLTLEVDWDAAGDFSVSGADVSSRLRAAYIERRGRDRASSLTGRSVAARFRAILNNDDGELSPYNSAAGLFGSLKPARRVRLKADDGAGNIMTRILYLERIEPRPRVRGEKIVELAAVGPIGVLNERLVEMGMETSIGTGAAIEAVLDAVGWPKTYRQAVLADAPVGYWPLNEASGDAEDVSGNGNDGTVTGATQGEASLVPGDTVDGADGGSYEFDGASGDVTVTDDAALQNVFDGGGSIEAWINPDSDGELNVGHVFKKLHGVYLEDESSGATKLSFDFEWSGGTAKWRTTNRLITIGSITHIVIVYDADATGNDPTFHINGTAYTVGSGIDEVTAPSGTRVTDAGTGINIGTNAPGSTTFDGHIDEVALLDAALTAAQVKAHYAAGLYVHRRIDAGQTTLARFWGENGDRLGRVRVLEALRQCEFAEAGFIAENADGGIAFEDRYHRLLSPHTASQGTFSDDPTDSLFYSAIDEEDPLPEIFNIFEAEVRYYTVGSPDVLWTLQESGASSPSIDPGQSRTWWATFPNRMSQIDGVAVNAWTTPVASTDYTANSQAGGGGSDLTGDLTVAVEKFGTRMKITPTNGAAGPAFMTLLQARGTPVTINDPALVRVEDEDSKAEYGERTWPSPARFIPDTSEAQDWGLMHVGIYKDPIPMLAMTYEADKSAALLAQALTRDLSERITVVGANGAGLGMDRDFFIESERHVITAVPQRHTVTYELSDAERFSDFWVVGVSALGSETRLAY